MIKNYEKKRTSQFTYFNSYQKRIKFDNMLPQDKAFVLKNTARVLTEEPELSVHVQNKIDNKELVFHKDLFNEIKNGKYHIMEVSMIKQVKGNTDMRVLLRSKGFRTNTILSEHAMEMADQNMCVVLSISSGNVVTVFNDDVNRKHKNRYK